MELTRYASSDLGGGNAQILGPKGNVLLNDRGDNLVIWILEHQAQTSPYPSVRLKVDSLLAKHALAQEFDGPLVGGQKTAEDGGER